jgi:hypothetical protein
MASITATSNDHTANKGTLVRIVHLGRIQSDIEDKIMSNEKYTIASSSKGKHHVRIDDEWGTEVLMVSINGWQYTGVQLTDTAIDLLEDVIKQYRAVKAAQKVDKE